MPRWLARSAPPSARSRGCVEGSSRGGSSARPKRCAGGKRADELRKEERRSLLELTSLLAEGSQAAAWLCWAATVKPASAVKADAGEYDARMRALLPRLFSAQAAASGLSETAFAQIDLLVQRLISLDTKLGTAAFRLDDSRSPPWKS